MKLNAPRGDLREVENVVDQGKEVARSRCTVRSIHAGKWGAGRTLFFEPPAEVRRVPRISNRKRGAGRTLFQATNFGRRALGAFPQI
jgi:hypothetical protein